MYTTTPYRHTISLLIFKMASKNFLLYFVLTSILLYYLSTKLFPKSSVNPNVPIIKAPAGKIQGWDGDKGWEFAHSSHSKFRSSVLSKKIQCIPDAAALKLPVWIGAFGNRTIWDTLFAMFWTYYVRRDSFLTQCSHIIFA